MPRSTRSQRGFILITALYTVALVGMYLSVAMTRSLNESQIARRYVESTQAFYLAEARVYDALAQLAKDPEYRVDTIHPDYQKSFPGVGLGFLTMTDQTKDDTIPDNAVRIRGIGTAGIGFTGVTRELETYVVQEGGQQPRFRYAALAVEDFVGVFGSGSTDSYHSENGAYNPSQAGKNGDIGSLQNSTNSHSIRVKQFATVNGDAFPAPEIPDDQWEDHVNVSHYGTITGNDGHGSQQVSMDEAIDVTVETPDGLDCSQPLKLSSGTTTKSGGTYCWSGIAIKNAAKLAFTEKATIYITGILTMDDTAQLFGPDKKPTQLQLINLGSGNPDPKILIYGESKFYGTILAPGAKIRIGGNGRDTSNSRPTPSRGQVFGAVIGKRIDVGYCDSHACFNANGSANSAFGGAIHYDEALRDPDVIGDDLMTKSKYGGKYEFIYWKQTK